MEQQLVKAILAEAFPDSKSVQEVAFAAYQSLPNTCTAKELAKSIGESVSRVSEHLRVAREKCFLSSDSTETHFTFDMKRCLHTLLYPSILLYARQHLGETAHLIVKYSLEHSLMVSAQEVAPLPSKQISGEKLDAEFLRLVALGFLSSTEIKHDSDEDGGSPEREDVEPTKTRKGRKRRKRTHLRPSKKLQMDETTSYKLNLDRIYAEILAFRLFMFATQRTDLLTATLIFSMLTHSSRSYMKDRSQSFTAGQCHEMLQQIGQAFPTCEDIGDVLEALTKEGPGGMIVKSDDIDSGYAVNVRAMVLALGREKVAEMLAGRYGSEAVRVYSVVLNGPADGLGKEDLVMDCLLPEEKALSTLKELTKDGIVTEKEKRLTVNYGEVKQRLVRLTQLALAELMGRRRDGRKDAELAMKELAENLMILTLF
ncbi:MAG: hypothetical protein P4M11_11790 [Candidatus Pacebacteria bacterium]|nr:hypothetical protein [Candidatus Paceibacterota bacterium]